VLTGKKPDEKTERISLMLSLQTNVMSLVAQQNLNVDNTFQANTISQLTSGYRINNSGDDPAGLAVANSYRDQVAQLTQGVSNGNDGVAQLQIMDGGMSNISQILDRLQTLATESSSSSFTGDRNQLNSEFQSEVGEIDRQAQSIGLNTGGTFAQNLAIYLGAGNGSQSQSNSIVNVDLSKSTVDAQSLGLTGVTAVNTNTYDLSGASATSVQNIVGNATNQAGETNANSGYTDFTFYGSGFSSTSSTSPNNNGITIAVNLNGVGDTTSLVNAINSAIQTAAQQPTSAANAFKTAGITASITTDASGNQKLSFSSANSAFQVNADDVMSNALMGNFAASGSAVGNTMSTTVTGAVATPANITAGTTLTITGAGSKSPVTVSVPDSSSGDGLTTLAGALQTEIQDAMGNSNVTVTTSGGALQFQTTVGVMSVTASGDTSDLGIGAANTVGGSKTYGSFGAQGAYELGNTANGTTSVANFTYKTLSDTQAITIQANDASGNSHTSTVDLTAANGGSISAAVATINNQLQQSNDSTLQGITAVVVNGSDGTQQINFTSTNANFKVSLAVAGTGTQNSPTEGIVDANGHQGNTISATQDGSGGALNISSQASAQTAVAAITNAVNLLGTAQANVGKGENLLNYAVNLASSQITNISSAESDIRDANVAQQAANLTQAQTLQQAAIAAMAQANSAPQAILSLLRG
jgi:flagellin